MSEANGAGRKRVVVLGGGVGSMTTAFELNHSGQPWDITVYQMGWRLGGKGASGRNMRDGTFRIEEHGVHMWSGLYDNAFRMMRQCYQELGRAPGAPLATWREAFVPRNFSALMEKYKGEWYPWKLSLPTNTELPGEPDARLFLPLWQYALEAIQLLHDLISQARRPVSNETGTAVPGPIHESWDDEGMLAELRQHLERTRGANHPPAYTRELGGLFGLLNGLLRKLMQKLWAHVRPRLDDKTTRQLWLTLNFTYANVVGSIEDEVLSKGFNVLNGQDYRQWLAKYLVDDRVEGVALSLESPLAYFLYDAEFAYLGGDLSRPDLEAGNALRTLVRMTFTWKGALLWQMQAGMGDVVFGPLYEVLKRRGVRFEFFHRVKRVQPSPDGKSVERIVLAVQARMVDPKAGYQPLVEVKGLPSWPSEPLWNQLVDGEKSKGEDVDFESYDGPEVMERVLERGRDFDAVVLGIPVAGLPYVAGDLIEVNPRWKDMVRNVRTVRTQGLQLWLKEPTAELGWTSPSSARTLLSIFHASPLSTWADMTQVLDRETWPPGAEGAPKSIAYFTGPMAEEAPPGATLEVSKELLARMAPVWPDAVRPGTTPGVGEFRWELLVDDQAHPSVGPKRLEAQYLRENTSPSERFTLSVTNSSRYRLAPGDSGFDNLVLAGDWTDNSFNIGNVEATAMSGMLASNALSGYPCREDIVGLDFGEPPPKPPRPPGNWGFLFVLLGLASLVVPAALTLMSVKQAGTLEIPSSNPTPFGYTWSLLLFLVPTLPMAGWLLTRPSTPLERKAFLSTLGTIFLIGCVLDFFFAPAFFLFPNTGATLGIRLPAWSFTHMGWVANVLPIEEFAFYALGGLYMLSLYVWSDVFWVDRYRRTDLDSYSKTVPRLFQFHLPSLLLAGAVMLGALLFKKFGPVDHEGFPGYFIFLTCIGLLPTLVLFRAVNPLINWRAVSIMFLALYLISLMWEATLGVPYNWWNYNHDMMLGIFINAWARLPVEAVVMWFVGGWGTVLGYEAFRLLLATERSWADMLFGSPATSTNDEPSQEPAPGINLPGA